MKKFNINILFYLFLFLMFLAKGIGLYDGQGAYRVLFWLGMLCAVGKILLTKYDKKEWVGVILCGILALLMERCSGEKGVLICYAVLAGMKGISLKRTMQIGAWTYGMTMCGMVTFYGIFLERSTFIEHFRAGLGDTIRYGLGYPHPNNLLMTYLAFVTMLIFCLGQKYCWKHALGLMLGNLYLYSYCLSYTGVITCTLAILLPLYWRLIRHSTLGKGEYFIGGLALPACLLYSYVIPFILPQSILDYLHRIADTIYSRMILPRDLVTLENISLLGTRVEQVTLRAYSLDNSFLYALVFNGVIFTFIIVILYIYMMYRIIKEKKDIELIFTCVFLLEALLEPLLFNTSFKNITLFFLGDLIWNNSVQTDENGVEDKNRYMEILNRAVKKAAFVWENRKKKILAISFTVGAVVMAVCTIKSLISEPGVLVDMATIRMNLAVAWSAGLGVFIVIYLGYVIKNGKENGML